MSPLKIAPRQERRATLFLGRLSVKSEGAGKLEDKVGLRVFKPAPDFRATSSTGILKSTPGLIYGEFCHGGDITTYRTKSSSSRAEE